MYMGYCLKNEKLGMTVVINNVQQCELKSLELEHNKSCTLQILVALFSLVNLKEQETTTIITEPINHNNGEQIWLVSLA